VYVDDPEQLAGAWRSALAADRPTVLEVKTDPEVPPLPPHITFKQARNMMHAVLKGDPDEAGLIKGSLKQIAAAFTHEKE
jgi:pyruvate dehydrogenase (quinone)